MVQHFFITLAVFLLFAVFHSVTAQEWFKDLLAKYTGSFFVTHFWRFVYCVISFYLLYFFLTPILWQQGTPFNDPLWTYPAWIQKILNAVRLLGVIITYIAFIQSDFLEFLGFKQMAKGFIKIFRKNKVDYQDTVFGTDRLVIKGIYAYIRHPMLAGAILIVFPMAPSFNNLIFLFLLTLYVFIGVYYEEKRLIRNFGNDYILYKVQVGGFIPKLTPSKYA